MASSSFRLHRSAFIMAFAIGIMVVYATSPKPEVVIKHPSPFNAGSMVYRGTAMGGGSSSTLPTTSTAESCFKFKSTRTECPRDAALIRPQPIDEGFRSKRTTVPRGGGM